MLNFLACVGAQSIYQFSESVTNNRDKFEEDLQNIFENVRDAAYHIINRKGATYYEIAMGVVRLTEAILNNESSILTVSCLIKGHYGTEDVYIGVPAILDREGVSDIIDLDLNEKVKNNF
ncbi:hypothetical protein [Gracilibacillus sp. YIM 98692]|uniref:hypothetical protein n=1 Tax=Gracilibacillus sp. YIM 98692 TaxID=2663532 RepID=UPI003204A3DA